MRMVRDITGRFGKRPHYEPRELDQECEDLIRAHLIRRHGQVTYPVTSDDLWALLEGVADDVDITDLSSWGPEVHGLTQFRTTGRPHVKISSDLTAQAYRVNRLRTTITHEYGHVKFHGFLYALEMESERLFTEIAPREREPICRRDAILGSSADWMEWQAGYVCGAILMPASETRRLVAEHVRDAAGPLQREDARIGRLAMATTLRFDVSDEAARMRLTKLGHIVPFAGMLTLPA